MKREQLLVALILASAILFTRCKDKPGIDNGYGEGDGTSISFDVIGLEDESSVNLRAKFQATPTTSLKGVPTVIAQEVIQSGEGDFDAVVTVTEEPLALPKASKTGDRVHVTGSESQKSSLRAATATMTNGNRYRVVLYDNGAYVTTMDAVAGTQFTFTGAYRNRTYTWFAYSYNSSATMQALNSTTSPTVNVEGGSGFLYDSGSFTTSNVMNGNNKFDITFDRKTANIELVVDARGMFGNILNITGNTTNASALKSGTFDLRTGTYGGYTNNSSTVSFTASNFVDYNNTYGAMMKRMSFFTAAGGQPISNLGITLTNVQIEGDRRTPPAAIPGSAGWGDPHAFSNITYNVPTFTPELGKRYRVAFTLVMTAKNVNNVLWARGNMYLHPFGDYRFRVHAASHVYGTVSTNSPFTTSEAAGEFFNWKALTAVSNPSNVGTTTSQDPCALVYPAGRWKMPTSAEATTLPTSTTIRTFQSAGSTAAVNNVNDSPTLNRAVRRAQYLFSGNDQPYDPQNRLNFLLFGYRSETSNSYTINGFNSSSSGNGYYWTSNQSSATLGTVLRIEEGAGTPVRTEGMLKTRGANIKCVRNTLWTESQIPALPDADYD